MRRFNVAPTQNLPVILDEAPDTLTVAKWGLIPSWAKDEKIGASLINARCETAATKPSFRSAFRHRRCLVPADGFYEWQKATHGKVPHCIALVDESPFAFAGVWETWRNPVGESLRTFSILTCAPNVLVAPIHDRMPVILRPENESQWLSHDTPVEKLSEILTPFPPELMKAYPVSSRVNNARIDDPTLSDPVAALPSAPPPPQLPLQGELSL